MSNAREEDSWVGADGKKYVVNPDIPTVISPQEVAQFRNNVDGQGDDTAMGEGL